MSFLFFFLCFSTLARRKRICLRSPLIPLPDVEFMKGSHLSEEKVSGFLELTAAFFQYQASDKMEFASCSSVPYTWTRERAFNLK